MDRVTTLRLNTYGMPRQARLGMCSRQHRGFPNPKRLTPIELYNGIRGCCMAARQAFADGHEYDLKMSMINCQKWAGELVRRTLNEPVIMVPFPEEYFESGCGALRFARLVRIVRGARPRYIGRIGELVARIPLNGNPHDPDCFVRVPHRKKLLILKSSDIEIISHDSAEIPEDDTET